MPNIELGKLERVDPRTIFTSEAADFTPWLAENLVSFNEALGLEIELVQREMPVGDFAVDIFGKEVGSGREVIIENQLASTDHSHLGQLLTYAAGLDAKIVVWISPKFRDEHRQALEWLNRDTTEELSFFGIELEFFKIRDSIPAPNFKLVAQPSEWQATVRTISGTGEPRISERGLKYHDFFSSLLAELKTRSPGYTAISRVGYRAWTSFRAGRRGFSFNAAFPAGNRFRIELYIDCEDYRLNKSAFDRLFEAKEEIEQAVGEPLVWERLDNRRACRISAATQGGIDASPEILDALKEWGVDRLIRFKQVFGPRLGTLRLSQDGS